MPFNIKPLAYSRLNNLIRFIVVELAWFFIEELGLIIAGIGLIFEFLLHQYHRYLNVKNQRVKAQKLKEHALLSAEKFHTQDRQRN